MKHFRQASQLQYFSPLPLCHTDRNFKVFQMDPTGSRRRLAVLAGQLDTSSSSGHSSMLVRQETASTAVRTLPKFDPYILETYLDDLREMKRQVYDLYKFKPELLASAELSKGLHYSLVQGLAGAAVRWHVCA